MSISNISIITAPIDRLLCNNANIVSAGISNVYIGYANVGILDVGTIGNGVTQLLDGANTSPSLTFINDITSGLYYRTTSPSNTMVWVSSGQALLEYGQNYVRSYKNLEISANTTSNVAGRFTASSFGDTQFSNDNVGQSLIIEQGGNGSLVLAPRFSNSIPLIVPTTTSNVVANQGVANLPLSGRVFQMAMRSSNSMTLEIHTPDTSIPGYGFLDSANTGINYNASLQSMQLLYNGISMQRITPEGSTFTSNVRLSNGTTSVPSLSFTHLPNSGIYSTTSPSDIGISVDGNTICHVRNAEFETLRRIRVSSTGNANIPSITLGTSADSIGLWATSDRIRFGTYGNVALEVGRSSNLTVSNEVVLVPSQTALQFVKTSGNVFTQIARSQDICTTTTGDSNQGIVLRTDNPSGITVMSGNTGSSNYPFQVAKSNVYSITSTSPLFDQLSPSDYVLRVLQRPSSTETRGLTGQLLMANGNITFPSVSFINSANVGLYLLAGNVMALSSHGVDALSISNSQVQSFVPLTSNVYAFSNATTTRMYTDGSHLLTQVGGTVISNVSSTVYTSLVPFRSVSGNGSIPTYAFTSSPGTGMWLNTGNILTLSVDNSSILEVSTSTVTSGQRVIVPNGTSLFPSIGFSSGTTTGLYYSYGGSPGTSNLMVSVETIERLRISAGGLFTFTGTLLASNGSISVPSYGWSNASTTGFSLDNSTGDIVTSISGVERMRVSSSNVSIGNINVSSIITKPSLITANITLTDTSNELQICNSSVTINVTLPTLTIGGKQFRIINVGSGAVVVQVGNSSIERFDGTTTINFTMTQHDHVHTVYYGSNWYIF